MAKEKNIEPALRDRIKALGGMALKLPAMHVMGLPDRLCLLPRGVLFFAETKSTGDKPSKIQNAIHNKLRALGFPVHVIDTKEKLNTILKIYDTYRR